MNLLNDYIFSDTLRYKAHRLIYAAEEQPIELTGMLAAAIFAALLVDTAEGDARGVAVDGDAQREQFFLRYEREVRREDWGYLSAEIRQLSDAYVQLTLADISLSSLCPNIRLLDLAMNLVVAYMRRLVKEVFGTHVWEALPWHAPFAQWLWDASRVETRRQRFIQTDWTDPAMVTQLADMPDEGELPSLFFEGEQASGIMDRYFQWLWAEYQSMKSEQPRAKITMADRNYILHQETDWHFMEAELADYDEQTHREWQRWMTDWQDFLTRQLKPDREPRFWAADVPEDVQEHLIYHLRLQEQQPAHFQRVTTAVYAMRYLGYVRRKCSDTDMLRWLSEHLMIDYTAKNNAYQFRRAMKDHSRYMPEVQAEVEYLESIGYHRFSSPSE